MNFIRKDWCMGFCEPRNHYIHKPFKNCRTYLPTPNIEHDPAFIIEWYNLSFELARIKREYVYLFFELEPPMKPLNLLWINHGDSNELVGVYTEKTKAEYDASRIQPKTHIGEYQPNQGKSLFLEPKPIQPEGEEEK